MLKSELIACAANVIGDKKQAAATLAALLEIAADALCKEGAIAIPGLGSFKLIERSARQGRHPQTGESLAIPARNDIKFTPTPQLKQEINDGTL